MNIVKDHIEYLKDNPKGYWFKRKLYGWGWTPAKPQGWITILLYLLGIAFLVSRLNETMSFTEVKNNFLLPFVVLTLVLIIICYLKGQKPKWQWGKQIED